MPWVSPRRLHHSPGRLKTPRVTKDRAATFEWCGEHGRGEGVEKWEVAGGTRARGSERRGIMKGDKDGTRTQQASCRRRRDGPIHYPLLSHYPDPLLLSFIHAHLPVSVSLHHDSCFSIPPAHFLLLCDPLTKSPCVCPPCWSELLPSLKRHGQRILSPLALWLTRNTGRVGPGFKSRVSRSHPDRPNQTLADLVSNILARLYYLEVVNPPPQAHLIPVRPWAIQNRTTPRPSTSDGRSGVWPPARLRPSTHPTLSRIHLNNPICINVGARHSTREPQAQAQASKSAVPIVKRPRIWRKGDVNRCPVLRTRSDPDQHSSHFPFEARVSTP